jgi:hypothetical protein
MNENTNQPLKKRFSIYYICSLDFKNNDNDNQLPFELTAVLAKAPPNQPRKRCSIYNISSLDFTT